MNKIFFKYLKVSICFVLIGFVQSCETLIAIPSSIIETSSKAIDYVGSVFEDDEDAVVETTEMGNTSISIKGSETEKNNQISNLESAESVENKIQSKLSEENASNQANITDYEQVLDAVPSENLIAEELLENSVTILDEIVEPEKKELQKESVLKFNFEAPELKLENKIQFRIATINFPSGSSALKREDIKKIKKVMEIALQKNAIVKIVGHASTRTRDLPELQHKLVNFNISDKRSQSVAKIFIDNKFPKKNLITEAVSDSKPLFHESMPAGTNRNQRTEIFIIY